MGTRGTQAELPSFTTKLPSLVGLYCPHYTNSLFPSSERPGPLPKVTSLVSVEPLDLPTVVLVLGSQNASVNSLIKAL